MHWDVREAEIWMIVGFLFIFIELIKMPGIGFLFLGLGGLSVAITIASERFELSYYQQIIAFVVYSSLWFAVLWRYLKKLNKANETNNYHDMLGNEVIVVNMLIPGKEGQVKWSGSIMNAKLANNEHKIAAIGETLSISAVSGNVLICKFIN